MSYPPFGLTEHEAQTLIRLAAAVADEAQPKPGTAQGFHDHPAYRSALTSFSEPGEVHALAMRTWKEIERGH